MVFTVRVKYVYPLKMFYEYSNRCKMGALEVFPIGGDYSYEWEMLHADTEEQFLHFFVRGSCSFCFGDIHIGLAFIFESIIPLVKVCFRFSLR